MLGSKIDGRRGVPALKPFPHWTSRMSLGWSRKWRSENPRLNRTLRGPMTETLPKFRSGR